MTSLRTEEFLEILQGHRTVERTDYKGYCTSRGSSSIVDSALGTQTGVPNHTFNPSSEGVRDSCVGERPKKKGRKTDSDFKEYIKKYINGV